MLIDTTLREGAQLYGASFSLAERKAIIEGLLAVGIEEIEVGWIGMEGLSDCADIIKKYFYDSYNARTSFSVWSPCREPSVKKAAELGFTRVNLGVPVSQKHMSKRLGMNRAELLERVQNVVSYACSLGLEVSVGMEDMSRADRVFSLEVARCAEGAGAFRIRLPDTVGLLNPLEMQELIRFFKSNLSCKVAVHCHNDFGMATANATTALMSGADYADVSVLGIGERAGIAALEEVAAYMNIRQPSMGLCPTLYAIHNISSLCTMVAKAAKISPARTKPIVGADIFACESGLHVHGLAKDASLFEPFHPEAIGASRRIAYGEKSGRGALVHALQNNSTPNSPSLSPSEIYILLQSVRQLANELGRPLVQDEVISLAQKTVLQ